MKRLRFGGPDVDWLDSCLSVRRGIVGQIVADMKTEGSARTFKLTLELLELLKSCKQRSYSSGVENWIFASPIKHGTLPYSYTGVWRELERATGPRKLAILGRTNSDSLTAHGPTLSEPRSRFNGR